MKGTITVTSKGQTTIPVALRRKLELSPSGGVLQTSFNENKGELVISKAADVTKLSERLSRYIKPGTNPVLDVNKYYQKHRS